MHSLKSETISSNQQDVCFINRHIVVPWTFSSSCLYLQLWVFLHHLQDDVATDGVTNQQQVGVPRHMLSKEGQLVFNLPVQPKNILLLSHRCIFERKRGKNCIKLSHQTQCTSSHGGQDCCQFFHHDLELINTANNIIRQSCLV